MEAWRLRVFRTSSPVIVRFPLRRPHRTVSGRVRLSTVRAGAPGVPDRFVIPEPFTRRRAVDALRDVSFVEFRSFGSYWCTPALAGRRMADREDGLPFQGATPSAGRLCWRARTQIYERVVWIPWLEGIW